MPHTPASKRDFLMLHWVVLLWGCTSVLGKLIDLPAIEIVLFRCLIAAATLLVMLRTKVIINLSDVIGLFGIGILIGLHWILFFLAVKISNVSICMVGIATVSLWTAILEPIILPEVKFRRADFLFGLLVIAAVGMIVNSQLDQSVGFAVAIGAAIFGAIFSILNASFANRLDHRVITFYEMLGAVAICGLCLPLSAIWLSEGRGLDLRPTLIDTIYLVGLAIVCTVYAFSQYVELLKRLSVFTVNFANNLEPVYGMLMGAIFFAEYESLNVEFYIGALAITVLVILQEKYGRKNKFLSL